LNLARAGNFFAATAYIALSLVLCLTAVWLGYLSESLFSR
jgi:fluoride ion exporter CrcB/FEX